MGLNMKQEKIQIDTKYVKLMPSVIRGLREYGKAKTREEKESKYFMVGDDLEVHFSDGCFVKLGDLDWRPAHSG